MAVTLAVVQQAISDLEKKGQKVTQRAVRARTGGDTGAVGVMIKQIMNARQQASLQGAQTTGQAPLPAFVQTVVDQAKTTIDQLAQEAVAAANQAVQAERDQMQQDMDQVIQDRDDAQQENIRFRQKIDELDKKVADQEADITRLKSDLAAATQAKVDLQAERDQARKDLSKTQDDLKAVRDQAAKDMQTHAEDVRKLNDDLTKLATDNAILRQANQDHEASIQRIQDALRKAQDEAYAKSIEAARLDAESKGLTKSEQVLQAEVKRLNGLLETSGKDAAQRTQELMELHDKYSRADQAREDAEKLVAMAEEARQQLAQQVADWRKRAEDAESTIRMQDAQITSKGRKAAAAE